MTEYRVVRLKQGGHIARWERETADWPGRLSSITLEGLEVSLVDDYGNVAQRHTCHPRDLIEGCFNEVIQEQFDQKVLDEVIAEIRRRDLGLEEHAVLPWPELGW